MTRRPVSFALLAAVLLPFAACGPTNFCEPLPAGDASTPLYADYWEVVQGPTHFVLSLVSEGVAIAWFPETGERLEGQYWTWPQGLILVFPSSSHALPSGKYEAEIAGNQLVLKGSDWRFTRVDCQHADR